MIWKKLGKIFEPNNEISWMCSHAAVPFVEKLYSSYIKIYFTTRNVQNKSLIAWIIIDINNPFKIIEISSEPVLDLGAVGFFDEDGTMGCQLIQINDKKLLYYQGWNLATSVQFRNSIGMAFFDEASKSFKKISNGPILDRSIYDNCFVATPNVFKITDDKYLMYYLSCDEWVKKNEKLTHKYNIKIAESNDGINWIRHGKIAINYESKYEYAFSVPRVIQENKIYKMWYSFRASEEVETYRMGYAESINGFDWSRKDNEVGIGVSSEGWDSQMICYPYIFDFEEQRYMLYNGNDYGRTGFGLAIML
ncbi:MAG: hypothetical protein ABI388_09955 [Bacteroidia bacterium]